MVSKDSDVTPLERRRGAHLPF